MPAAGTNLCLGYRAIPGNSSVLQGSRGSTPSGWIAPFFSLLDHQWEQQSLGGLNDSDLSH